MAYTYDQFRRVLRKLGFQLLRSRKHGTWVRVEPDGTVRRVRVSHQKGKDIPPPVFSAMLRQIGLSRDEFARLLKDP